MTPQEKQKTIAEQAIYGDLKCKAISGLIYPIKCSYDDVVMVYESSIVLQEDIKPILRPLYLTKEITHRGYNENQPFVPLHKINEISNRFNVDDCGVLWFNDSIWLCDADKINSLLNLWHFDRYGLIEKSEAISTDEVNPYEVK